MLSPKKKDNQEKEMADRVNQDLVVHNMPNSAKISPARRPANPQSGLKIEAPATHNFKAVGLIIIIGGVIVIGVLAYLGYRFIIQPSLKPNPPATNVKKPEASRPVATNTPATTTVISVTTTTLIDLATSSSATTSSLASSTMPEELTGKNVSNLPPLIDTDNDGLNDDEEGVLGTSATSTDTNGNGYQDLIEINNNYNPLGTGRLNAAGSLSRYSNQAIGYELLYPKLWTIKSLNNDATTIFTAGDDSIIQISVQDNTDKQSILSWYESSFPTVTVTYDKLKSSASWEGIMGEDGLNFYLTDKNRQNIYVISYIPAVDNRLVYPNIFKLMIDSLVIK